MTDAQGESPTTPKPSVTVAQLDELVAKIFEKRKEIEAAELVTSKLNIELAKMKQDCVVYLKELGRENYKSPYGSISVQQKWRVNMPQTDAEKQALFEWMREKGIYDKYATVNSASLNSLWNAEREAAAKRGELMEFEIPGLGAGKLFEDLGMRKG